MYMKYDASVLNQVIEETGLMDRPGKHLLQQDVTLYRTLLCHPPSYIPDEQ